MQATSKQRERAPSFFSILNGAVLKGKQMRAVVCVCVCMGVSA